MRLAVVLVHYHTPRLAAEAVAALRADLGESGIEARYLLIDNGSDADGKAELAQLPVEVIDPGENLGFAGGVNLGVQHSSADAFLLMNVDVLVRPGCVEALLAVLAGGAACAGPCFFWDRGCRLLLPPTELRSRRDELLSALAQRGGRWARFARSRSRRHGRRHWEAAAPLPSYSLSGSLLAVSRSAWEQVGPFDTAYRLYFEETDWLVRLRRARLRAFYVPAAKAVHLYARSSLSEARAAGWFADSARRFRRQHYGLGFERLLALTADHGGRREAEAAPEHRLGDPLPLSAAARWVEVSPNRTGIPAAAERLDSPPGNLWSLPAEIVAGLPQGSELWVRECDDTGKELSCRTLRLPPPADPGRHPR